MKTDVVLAGLGGQGVLSAGAILAAAALEQDLLVKTVETRGMSQRGGPVHIHVRLSDAVIHSSMIPAGRADILLAMEPIEAVRNLHYLHSEGRVYANEAPSADLRDAPRLEQALAEIRGKAHSFLLNATALAREAGSPRSANLVILGAASARFPVDLCRLEGAIRFRFQGKGEATVAASLRAFRSGREAAVANEPSSTRGIG